MEDVIKSVRLAVGVPAPAALSAKWPLASEPMLQIGFR